MKIRNRNNALPLMVAGILGLSSSQALASGAVTITPFDGGDNSLSGVDVITANNYSGIGDSYKDITLDYSAAGYDGHWFTFETLGVLDVTINAQSTSGDFSPGLTVWASGNAPFDGGSTTVGTQVSATGHPTPESFNATSVIGAPGTLWMADSGGGNLIETLGYAVSGPSHTNSFVCLGSGCPTSGPTGWGETIQHGAHDISLTNNFEQGVSGNVSPVGSGFTFGFGGSSQFAELSFNNLQPGWYTVFVGGTDGLQNGGIYDLTISAVPEMETWAMMLAGMGFLGWRAKRQQAARGC